MLATVHSHLSTLERCFPNSKVYSHLAMAMAYGSVCGERYVVDALGRFKDEGKESGRVLGWRLFRK